MTSVDGQQYRFKAVGMFVGGDIEVKILQPGSNGVSVELFPQLDGLMRVVGNQEEWKDIPLNGKVVTNPRVEVWIESSKRHILWVKFG